MSHPINRTVTVNTVYTVSVIGVLSLTHGENVTSSKNNDPSGKHSCICINVTPDKKGSRSAILEV